MRAALAILACIFLTGCQTFGWWADIKPPSEREAEAIEAAIRTDEPPRVCEVWTFIELSRSDTPGTIEQGKAMNAAREAWCDS